MAETFYNLATGTHNATSAGAAAKNDEHISPRAIKIMNEIDIDMRSAAPKQLTPEMISAADRVILFPSDFMPDYAKNSEKAELWEVIDPFYHKEEGMELVRRVRDDIRGRVAKMVGGHND